MIGASLSFSTPRHTRTIEACFTSSAVFDIGAWDVRPEFVGWYITVAGLHIQYCRQMAGVAMRAGESHE